MNKNVSIITKEQDLEVIYGDFQLRGKEEDARTSLKYILSDLTDIKKYYIRLGFHLNEFSKMGYYFDFGFATLSDFCEANLGMDKSAVSRCINVYRLFNASNDVTYSANLKTRGCAMELSDKYKAYSYNQLCEMISMSPSDRKAVTPDMTIQQIRDLKKSLKNKQYYISDSVATSQPKDTDKTKAVATSQPKNRLSVSDLSDLSGLSLCNKIRNCDVIGFKNVHIFGKNGKKLFDHDCCHVLLDGNKHLVIRLDSDRLPHSGKTKHTVIEIRGNTALIMKDDLIEPFIVALEYDQTNGTWGIGKSFKKIFDAADFFNLIVNEKNKKNIDNKKKV